MKKRLKKKLLKTNHRGFKSRAVSIKKGISLGKDIGYTFKKVYQVNPYTGRKECIGVTRINLTTGSGVRAYKNIPIPDKAPPMPGGAKPPKRPDSTSSNPNQGPPGNEVPHVIPKNGIAAQKNNN